MISKGEPKENRAKVKEHGLTFPVVLQQQWEISRRYAMFATPVAYLINEQGIIAHDVAAGSDAILDFLARAGQDLGGITSALRKIRDAPASVSSLLQRYDSDKISLMSPANPGRDDSPATSMCFHTTHWTVGLAAREKDGAVGREALASLCPTYW